MLANPLAYEAPDPIASYRVPYFLGDRDPEPSDEPGITSFSCEREQVTTVNLRSCSLDFEELGSWRRRISFEMERPRRVVTSRYFLAIVTEMRLRPLARRRRSTSRPPRVFLRARKPWVRLRLLLWG